MFNTLLPFKIHTRLDQTLKKKSLIFLFGGGENEIFFFTTVINLHSPSYEKHSLSAFHKFRLKSHYFKSYVLLDLILWETQNKEFCNGWVCKAEERRREREKFLW